MRLKNIKLSGFKSFVDPITIPIAGDLVGVVGPNGCGKSNIIDAVRWVMGESSARHLRGESLNDVIFSGSTSRKPVSRAAVELIFDNSDGSAGGQYAGYGEISIRREASRDGESEYYLNRVRCRRKDIMDLFLGTGLGPRAYAIIEQGMVTRIIESKPEELRVLFDEAAGVSRYKERRRETELRIRRARENLARVDDVRAELEGQLSRLQRQARTAARFQEMKAEERRLRLELFGVRFAELDQLLADQARVLFQKETELEEALARQHQAEAALEVLRSDEQQARERVHALEAEVQRLGAEIGQLTQQIAHLRAERDRQQQEQAIIDRDLRQVQDAVTADQDRRRVFGERLEALASVRLEADTAHEQALDRLREAEQAVSGWRGEWSRFTVAAAEPGKRLAVETARARDLERQLQDLTQRAERLVREAAQVDQDLQDDGAALRADVAEKDRACDSLSTELEQLESTGRSSRSHLEELAEKLSAARGEAQTAEARLASLDELQGAALGREGPEFAAWLDGHTRGADRLGPRLNVEPGWEKAVERVLGSDLGAVVVADLDRLVREGFARDIKALVVYEECQESTPSGQGGLQDLVQGPTDLQALFATVQGADTLEDALGRRRQLQGQASLVTRDGIWVGRNWARFPQADSGVLLRAREMDRLRQQIGALQARIQELQQAQLAEQEHNKLIDSRRQQARAALAELNRVRAGAHAALGQKEARLAQLNARQGQLLTERQDLHERVERLRTESSAVAERTDEARRAGNAYAEQGRVLELAGKDLEQAEQQARGQERASSGRLHQLDLERQGIQAELAAATVSEERLQQQMQGLLGRRTEVEARLAQASPEPDIKTKVDALLEQRLVAEARVREAAGSLAEIEGRRIALEERRQLARADAEGLRADAEQLRIRRQEYATRRDALAEQTVALGETMEAALAAASARPGAELEGEIAALIARIERLGAINLGAIAEHEETEKRKTFLDRQQADLTQALASLEEAIHQIDKETRTRFRDTFDRVNAGFQAFFPRLFGGGQAALELVGDDLLETGVNVVARPPGKRNATIHLLSGGEKALTAVALIFAIFELNPAPFCLLDEVDAPLDDTNVARYAQTLRAMAEHTQLLFITHNKVSMEAADVLLGVTMAEPGVSRLVAVDVQEAVRMVADQRRVAP